MLNKYAFLSLIDRLKLKLKKKNVVTVNKMDLFLCILNYMFIFVNTLFMYLLIV